MAGGRTPHILPPPAHEDQLWLTLAIISYHHKNVTCRLASQPSIPWSSGSGRFAAATAFWWSPSSLLSLSSSSFFLFSPSGTSRKIPFSSSLFKMSGSILLLGGLCNNNWGWCPANSYSTSGSWNFLIVLPPPPPKKKKRQRTKSLLMFWKKRTIIDVSLGFSACIYSSFHSSLQPALCVSPSVWNLTNMVLELLIPGWSR